MAVPWPVRATTHFNDFFFSFVTVLPGYSWLRLGKGNGKTKKRCNCELFEDFWLCEGFVLFSYLLHVYICADEGGSWQRLGRFTILYKESTTKRGWKDTPGDLCFHFGPGKYNAAKAFSILVWDFLLL